MSDYRIIISNYNNPSDTGEIIFSQNQINSFLDSCAPYEEKAILKDSNDTTLIPVVTIEVETAKDLFQWHNKYYSKETFTLMVLDAVKKNTLALIADPQINSFGAEGWKKEREESISEVLKAHENRKYD
jgi:hypothetical protein